MRDVMDRGPTVLSPGTSLSEIIKIVSTTESSYYPVVDDGKRVIGAITLAGIRNTFTTQELNDWLVALDVMESVIARVGPETALSEAFELARRVDVEHVPVTSSVENNDFVGLLDCRAVRRALSAEVLARQQKADSIHSVQQA